MAIFKDHRRHTPVLYNTNNKKNKPRLFSTNTGVLDNEQRRQLQLMVELLNSCLPVVNTATTTTTIHDEKEKWNNSRCGNHYKTDEHFKALANEYISMDDFLTNSESSSLINNTDDVDDKNSCYNAAAIDDDDNNHNNNNSMVHKHVRPTLT
ncbi:unnamed protein product, partial [Trichobilharzia regenti]